MPNLFVVRSQYGKYTSAFLRGGYAAIGWLQENNLEQVRKWEELTQIFRNAHSDFSNIRIGQAVGQIYRFVNDIKPGDYVITQSESPEKIIWGVATDRGYYFETNLDECPYPHRIGIKWNNEPVLRTMFSVPFQNSVRSMLTVFAISHEESFLTTIGRGDQIRSPKPSSSTEPHEVILKRLLELTSDEFEYLVHNLLTAIGFDAKQEGGPWDGGVDVRGTLSIAGVAQVDLVVQVKRYEGKVISQREILNFRGRIPNGSQGAYITLSKFRSDALEAATEPGFVRIGTIDGNQLVDLLTEHWDQLTLSEEIKNKLNLRIGLIPD